jgi:hypothetical protein
MLIGTALEVIHCQNSLPSKAAIMPVELTNAAKLSVAPCFLLLSESTRLILLMRTIAALIQP